MNFEGLGLLTRFFPYNQIYILTATVKSLSKTYISFGWYHGEGRSLLVTKLYNKGGTDTSDSVFFVVTP